MKTLLYAAVLLTSLCLASEAGQVTLVVNSQPIYGTVILSDEIAIGTNEVATVKSVYGNGAYASLVVTKNGITNSFNPQGLLLNGYFQPIVIAGPATLRLTIQAGFFSTWNCSAKIEPESFPPDKTIIIPQGTPGANIIMEQSSDLVHWTNSVPGLYTNTAISHLFFRLRAERL